MDLRRFIPWLKPNFAGGGTRPEAAPSAGSPPRHFGELWSALQEIAREESPLHFAEKPVSEHAAESLEGKKDVERWLEILKSRTIPGYRWRFPAHHRRHRGLCLIPRQWPGGILWEAFDETTLLKAPIEPERSCEELVAAVDRALAAR